MQTINYDSVLSTYYAEILDPGDPWHRTTKAVVISAIDGSCGHCQEAHSFSGEGGCNAATHPATLPLSDVEAKDVSVPAVSAVDSEDGKDVFAKYVPFLSRRESESLG